MTCENRPDMTYNVFGGTLKTLLSLPVYIFAGESIGVSSTTFTWSVPKATEFDKITQRLGILAVQGHSRSPILVPIESLYVASY